MLLLVQGKRGWSTRPRHSTTSIHFLSYTFLSWQAKPVSLAFTSTPSPAPALRPMVRFTQVPHVFTVALCHTLSNTNKNKKAKHFRPIDFTSLCGLSNGPHPLSTPMSFCRKPAVITAQHRSTIVGPQPPIITPRRTPTRKASYGILQILTR